MAKLSKKGFLIGQVGGIVYRRGADGRIVASERPAGRKAAATPEAREQQSRFRKAVEFSKAVRADPIRAAGYEKLARRRGRRAGSLHAFIVGDWLNPPVVTEIVIRDYRRRAGDPIAVWAKDDGEVLAVELAIKTPDGAVLESGAATATPLGWRYVATRDAPPGVPLTVVGTATDRAGNTGSAETTIAVT